MVDIHSATAEIRRGKKIEDRKKPQGKNIMASLLHRAAITRRDASYKLNVVSEARESKGPDPLTTTRMKCEIFVTLCYVSNSKRIHGSIASSRMNIF